MPRAPRNIQGWTLSKVLGEGTDGVVALYTKGNQKIVFKFPTKHGLEYVRQEELVLKRVAKKRHRNLVAAYVGLKPGKFLAQEYVEGVTLASYVERNRITPALARQIVAQITTGVQALHAIGFAHNDLHLANIMINPTSQEVFLIDYGRATSANVLLRNYDELHWKYTVDPESTARVTIRDYAFIAGANAWLQLHAAAKGPITKTENRAADQAHQAAIYQVLKSVSLQRPQRTKHVRHYN